MVEGDFEYLSVMALSVLPIMRFHLLHCGLSSTLFPGCSSTGNSSSRRNTSSLVNFCTTPDQSRHGRHATQPLSRISTGYHAIVSALDAVWGWPTQAEAAEVVGGRVEDGNGDWAGIPRHKNSQTRQGSRLQIPFGRFIASSPPFTTF